MGREQEKIEILKFISHSCQLKVEEMLKNPDLKAEMLFVAVIWNFCISILSSVWQWKILAFRAIKSIITISWEYWFGATSYHCHTPVLQLAEKHAGINSSEGQTLICPSNKSGHGTDLIAWNKRIIQRGMADSSASLPSWSNIGKLSTVLLMYRCVYWVGEWGGWVRCWQSTGECLGGGFKPIAQLAEDWPRWALCLVPLSWVVSENEPITVLRKH